MLGCAQEAVQGIVARGLLFFWAMVKRKSFDLNPKDVGWSNQPRAAKVSYRSVFEVDGRRLAIGHFSRPLDAEECRRLRSAWERSTLPGVEDFEVTSKQVSFLTPPPGVDSTWKSIDALLAGPLAKAS
jgi:hypothetical protein